MDTVTLILIALGLSMDTLAVSVASGFAMKPCRMRNALRMAFSFGFFQAMMPLLGWVGGTTLEQIIAGYDHWVAFGLLTMIGSRMIYQSVKNEKPYDSNPMKWHFLLALSLATSIDALAVGVTFAILKTSIWTPVLVIGMTTFTISFAGVFIGNRFGHFFEKKIERAGGLILIGIGIKILLEHLLKSI